MRAMHRTILVLAAAALVCGATLAQTAVKRTAAGKVAPTKKPVPRNSAPKKATSAAVAPANDEQRGAAELAYVGDYACEFNQTLSVAPNPTYEAYVDVRFGKRLFTMKPVLSSTGALRLEEVAGDALMIQIPFKSMLLDNRLGRRLVDECVHEKQSLAKLSAAKEPPGPGLGIDPSLAAPAAPQAAASAPGEAASTPEPASAPAATPR
jgi:hypothetical protein